MPRILDEPRSRLRTAALMSFPAGDAAGGRVWQRTVAAIAKQHGIRLLGPGAFGVVRTDIGLNATFCAPIARPGRLALVAQSGAVCTAMLDFAGPLHMGFSTVTSLGGGIDIDFGELLDALVDDPVTDGILLYVEAVADARTFMSALRKAARTKPVVVLKAGRSRERAPAHDAVDLFAVAPDVVFDAALTRAGSLRVRTYTQLFAAARILAQGRIPSGNRLAIVGNGRGPGLLAADSAVAAGVSLAIFARATVQALDAVLPPEIARENPVDVRGDAPPERLAAAVTAVLADPGTDAVLALHVPRPIIGAVEAAHALAAVARDSRKPVLAAWLGALDRPEVQHALETGGIANFFTPENAVDAFAFLAAYRRNQEWLLEVPSPNPDPEPPELAAADEVRVRALGSGLRELPPDEIRQLLAAFGIATAPVSIVTSLAAATAAARELHYPVTLTLEGAGDSAERSVTNARALTRAWREMQSAAGDAAPIAVARATPPGMLGAYAVALATDPVFGPVIAAGPSMRGPTATRLRAVMLPPLNHRLAVDLLTAAGLPAADASLVQLVLRVSALACALPWVRTLVLDPVTVTRDGIGIAAAQVIVEPKRKPAPGYRHMAIHPYPAELEALRTLPDGAQVFVRPVRPEDAALEQHFVASLSEETRFFRFFYRLHELTPAMLGRFTQVDYDRELALLALVPDAQGPGGKSIIGIARYIANLDQESAEFAVVVADSWHGRGVATLLMKSLIACARKKGLSRLVGTVLRANQNMLRFTQHLGLYAARRPGGPGAGRGRIAASLTHVNATGETGG